MKRLVLYIMAMMSSACVMAQKIHIDKTSVNIGSTLWKHPLTATFKVTNKDKHPLLISNVDPGCGCLSATWPQHPLHKGETGVISVTYDAKMLGHFDRIIEVHSNGSEKPERIRMRGVVTTDATTHAVADLYPYHIDDVYLSTNNIEFPEVHKGDSVHVMLEVFNNTNEVYKPQLMHLPPYITAKYRPKMLGRGRRGIIELTLHSDKLPGYGLNQTSIYVARYVGDKVGTNNDIAVSSILLPDVSEYIPGTAKPEFVISTSALDLGTMGSKSKLKGKVTITNAGTDVLKLSNIQAFNPAMTISVPKTELKPGEKTTMSITVQKKYLNMSKAKPRILIITNDPQHSQQVVDIVFRK